MADDLTGVDEADESFLNNLFFAAHDGNAIDRAVMKTGALDQLSKTEVFLNSGFLADCPDGWTDMAAGRDGFLYAVARNAGGAGGGLYRVIHDAQAGPREVSKPGSSFPLRVDRGATAGEVVISFEDLRSDIADVVEAFAKAGKKISLQDAYKRALAMNPDLEPAPAAPPQITKSQAAAILASRNAASSISGNPRTDAGPKPTDRRSQIAAAWENAR